MKWKNEDGFGVLIQRATVSILVVNQDGTIELANPCAEQLFGYEKGDLLGKPVETLVESGLNKNHSDFRNTHFSTPGTIGADPKLKAVRKDGTTFPAEISLGPFEVEGQKLAIAFITDQTEKQKIVAGREARFRSMTDNSPVMIWVSDQNRLCTYFNRTWLTFTGRTLEQELGYGWTEGVHPEDLENCLRIYNKAFDDLTPFKMEYRLLKKGKKYRWILDKGRPVYSADGTFEGYIGSCVDINLQKTIHDRMRKKAERRTSELKHALERERELSELKSRFVSIASHEFRTPLSALLSSTSLIEQYLKRQEPDKCEKHITRIKVSVRHLIDTLGDFLSLEKLEQGKIEIANHDFDLKQFAEDLISEIRPALKPGQVIHHLHEGDIEVYLDTNILRHVLLNLISNASKYSNEGKIVLITRVENTKIQLIVTDTGIGIPEKQQELIFQRFFRAGNTGDIQGTGLGLSIVKNYVELLGGRIYFISKVNEGTHFFVEFPRNISTE